MDNFRISYLVVALFVCHVTGQSQDTLIPHEFSFDPVFSFPLDPDTTTPSPPLNTENVKQQTSKVIDTEPKGVPSTSGSSNASDPISSVLDFGKVFGINFGMFGNNQGTSGSSDSNVVPLDALDKALDQIETNPEQNNSLSSDHFTTDFFNFLNSESIGSGPESTAPGTINDVMSGTQPELSAPSVVDKSGTTVGSRGTEISTTTESTPFEFASDPFADFPAFGVTGTPAETSAITNDKTTTVKPPTSKTLDPTEVVPQDPFFSENPFFSNNDPFSQQSNFPETAPVNNVDNSNQLNVDTNPSTPTDAPFSIQQMPSNPFQDLPPNPFQMSPMQIPQTLPMQPQRGNVPQLNIPEVAPPTESSPFQANFPSPNNPRDISQPSQAPGNTPVQENQQNFLPLAENLLSQVQTLVTNMKTQNGQDETSATGRPRDVCQNGRPRAVCDRLPCVNTYCVNILNARCERACDECRARFFIGEKEVTDICQLYHYPRQNTGSGPQMPREVSVRQPEARGQLPERGPPTEVMRGMPVDSHIIIGPDGRPMLVPNRNTRDFMRVPPRDSFRRVPVGIPDSRLPEMLPGRFSPDTQGMNNPEQRRNGLRPLTRRPGRPDPRDMPFPPRGIPFLARVNPPADVILGRGRNGAQRQLAEAGRPQPRERPPFDWPPGLSRRTVTFPGEIAINQEQPGNPQQQSGSPPQLPPSAFQSFPDPRIIASFRRGQNLAREIGQFSRPNAFPSGQNRPNAFPSGQTSGQNRFNQNPRTRSQRPDAAPRNAAQQSTNISPVSGDNSRSRSGQVDPGMLNAFRRFVAAQENARPRRRFAASSF